MMNCSSSFSELISQYIQYKRSLGYNYDIDYVRRFKRMDAFLAKDYCYPDITLSKEMVLKFIKKRGNEANSTISYRCSMIRGFAIFLKQLGYKNIYILPNEYIPKDTTAFIPYIFSKEEINILINIIDNYNFGSKYLNEHKIYSLLIRLLYCCGLRISEALSLKISNINLDNYIIHITKAKNNSSRIVCMSNSLVNSIKHYVHNSKLTNNDFLFPNINGNRYDSSSVSRFFKKFFKQANIYTKFGKLPRIHDFRHSFCVHSLEQMINNGIDIYCALPFLSSYLGHKNIYSTEIYLRLIEGNFPNLLLNNSNLIFPEVNVNDN